MATRAVAKKRRKNKITIPLALICGFLPYIDHVRTAYNDGGFKTLAKVAPEVVGYNGFDRKWGFRYMGHAGTMAIVGGWLIHKLASRLGVNRAMAGAGIPFLRL